MNLPFKHATLVTLDKVDSLDLNYSVRVLGTVTGTSTHSFTLQSFDGVTTIEIETLSLPQLKPSLNSAYMVFGETQISLSVPSLKSISARICREISLKSLSGPTYQALLLKWLSQL